MSKRSISGLVVATSSGVPMRSARPKPIHLLCGRAMASYVLDTLAAVGVRQGVVVTGVEGGRISKRLLEDPPGFPVRFVEQKLERGHIEPAQNDVERTPEHAARHDRHTRRHWHRRLAARACTPAACAVVRLEEVKFEHLHPSLDHGGDSLGELTRLQWRHLPHP